MSHRLALAILDDYQGVALECADWSPLAGRVDVTVFRDTEHDAHDAERLAARLAPFDILCTMRERTPFPRALVERLPRLRLLCTTGMFNRAFDLAALGERGVTVCGTDSPWISTAEHTWALLLGIARQVHREDAAMRAGRWQTTLGAGLAGRTLGLVGLGKIAARVAAVARAFDMRVIAWSRNLTDERCAEVGAEHVDKHALFAQADFVSLHYVLAPSTVGIVGAAELAAMRPHAMFVNTSRGPLVDEPALVDALRRRAIGGAALDVFDREPIAPDHPLLGLDNVLLSPHLGYVTREQYATYFAQTVENVRVFLDGAPPRRPLRAPPT